MSRIAHYDPPAGLSRLWLPKDYRAEIVAYAASQIGIDDRELYFRDAAPCYTAGADSNKHWCGIFVLHCYRRAGLCDWLWKDVSGFIGEHIGWARRVGIPEPGDVCYCERASHHAVVAEVQPGRVTTIDGNSGPVPPGFVREHARPLPSSGVRYYSIGKVIARALERDFARWRSAHAA